MCRRYFNINTFIKDARYVLPDESTPINLDSRVMASMRYKERNLLYLSRGVEGALQRFDISRGIERGANTAGWAWDAEFFDFDNDGDDDLYLVNGTNDYFLYFGMLVLENDNQRTNKLFDYNRESNVFYVNEGGALRNRSAESGADLLINSRSAAYLDFDGDGDLDIALNNFQAPAVFLRNNAEKRGNHWIKLKLIGDPDQGCTRDAIGARILATTPDGNRIWREIHGGSGYLSMDPKEQHLGLGTEQSVDLQILWPGGERQEIQSLPAGRSYVIEQGRDPSVKSAP